MTEAPAGAGRSPSGELMVLLTPEVVDRDISIADPRLAGPGLFGGQVAAQALLAAAGTVPPDRVAHSLHGYFLRRGDASRRVLYTVERDRDGRSYSARRVVARQGGQVIFNMAASFAVPEDGPEVQAVAMPEVPAPEDSAPVETHLVGIEVRDPDPRPDRLHPTRVWVRCIDDLGPDPHAHAAVLTYVSDLFSGLSVLGNMRPTDLMTSLDHALWFHRPARLDRWILMDHLGAALASGRGWYTGHLYDESGTAVAGLAQQMVLRSAQPGL
jgi:acyl-CoA thioesterase-2